MSTSRKRNDKVIAIAVLCAGLLLCWIGMLGVDAYQAWKRQPDAETLAAAAALGLKAPVNVTSADIYLDGGTLLVVLCDARGTEVPFFHEAMMQSTNPDGSAETTYIRGRAMPAGTVPELYRGTPRMPDEDLKRITPGSATERQLLTLIEAWRKREYSYWQCRRVRNAKGVSYLDESQVLLLRVMDMERILNERQNQPKPE